MSHDRRVRKTQTAIKDALITLLERSVLKKLQFKKYLI